VGRAADQILERIPASGTKTWYLNDRLGTVRDISQQNGGGSIVDHVIYDSYGQVTSETNAANGDRFKYVGMEYDATIWQYYDRARYYDEAIGRFMRQDPKGFEAGDKNLYRYVGNAPTNGTDPSGLEINIAITSKVVTQYEKFLGDVTITDQWWDVGVQITEMAADPLLGIKGDHYVDYAYIFIKTSSGEFLQRLDLRPIMRVKGPELPADSIGWNADVILHPPTGVATVGVFAYSYQTKVIMIPGVGFIPVQAPVRVASQTASFKF
jgi:RHS repeat-associated protein